MKLICFGDSWTAGHGVEENIKYKEVARPQEFIKKLREQNSWPRWVAEKLNCPYVNMGVCGYGNRYILNELTQSINWGFVNPRDIVIVMLSYPYRYSNKDTSTVIETFYEFETALQGHKHFYFNSFYPTFKDEDFDTNKLPETFINPNGSVSEILREYEIKNDISVWEYGSRSVYDDINNFYVGDYHPNLLGYQIIGGYIFEQIKNHAKL